MRTRVFIAMVLSLVLTGCVEPYPGWTVSDILFDEMPRRVRQAFKDDHGDVTIHRVERSTFGSRLSGYPKKYRIFFETESGEVQRNIYNGKGQLEDDGFDFWFGKAGNGDFP